MKKVILTSFGVLATAMAFGQGFFPMDSLVVTKVNGTTSASATVDLIGFNFDGSSNSKSFSLGTNFTMSGSATSEGQMNASLKYLALGGYNAAAGVASIASTAGTANNRRVAVFDNLANGGLGGVSYVEMASAVYSGNNIRAAYSSDGVNVLTAGNAANPNGGWRTGNSGGTTQLGTTANTRVIKEINGVVYGSTASGTTAGGNPHGIYSLSGGTQTSVIDTTDASSSYDFDIYSENANSYFLVTDDRSTATGGGLQVWKNGSLLKTIAVPSTTSALRSVAVRDWWNNGVRQTSIFGIANLNTVVGITFDYGHIEDAGVSTFTSLATAGAGTNFRSIEIVPEPASFAMIGIGLVGFAARRRRKN